MSIYKACDIRGIYGRDLEENTAYRIGRAIGTILEGGPLAVAGDERLSTPALSEALIQGLVASGCEVSHLGVLPTPVFYFYLASVGAHHGVMVTASHNPAEYNGFKVSMGFRPVTEEDIRRIGEIASRGTFIGKAGSRRPVPGVLEDYERSLAKTFHRAVRSLRIIVDGGNGVAGDPAVRLLRESGHEVIPLYCNPDGRFPNRQPNPAVASNLAALCRAAIERSGDLGVAFDGDGDRVVFVDANGQILPSEKALIIFARDTLSRKPSSSPGERPALTVVYDLKCSGIVPETVRDLGGIPEREKSGHAFIKRAFLERGAALAGEISGHFFFRDIGRDDGIYAALKMADILSRSELPLAEIAAGIHDYCITPDIRIPYAEDRTKLLHQFRASLSDYPIDTLDGVRVEFHRGWALLRISVTEPVVTLRMEGKTQSDLDSVEKEVRRAVPVLAGLLDQYLGRDPSEDSYR